MEGVARSTFPGLALAPVALQGDVAAARRRAGRAGQFVRGQSDRPPTGHVVSLSTSCDVRPRRRGGQHARRGLSRDAFGHKASLTHMAQVLSESVALATKCCVPDAPARPKALEERVKSIEGRAEWQLKLTWAKPNGNGHPIQQYCLQQSERLSQAPLAGAQRSHRADSYSMGAWRSRASTTRGPTNSSGASGGACTSIFARGDARRLLPSQLLPTSA